MILLHADMTHENVTVRALDTTQAGHAVVLVDGVPYVVREVRETVLRLVAQTFDPPPKSARIVGIIKDGPAVRKHCESGPSHDEQIKETS